MHGQATDPRVLAGDGSGHRHAAVVGHGADALHGRGVVDVADPQATDGQPVEDGRQPCGVVGVWVAEHDEVEPPDAAASQPLDRRVLVGTAVDQDPRAATLDQDRVALADVDRGDGQDRGGRTSHGHDERGGHGHDRRRPGPPGSTWHQEPARHRHDEREQCGACRRHHGEVGQATGRQDQAGGKVGQGEQQAGRGGVDDGDDRRRDRDHRRCGRRRDRDQVGRDRRERHLADPQEQHRRDRDLRPDRHGDHARERSRPPVEAASHQRRHQQHPGGGGRGQQQAEGAGQRRVDRQQHQQGDPEAVERVGADTTDLRDDDGAGHHRRPQDGRLGSGQQHEPPDAGAQQHPPTASPEAGHPGDEDESSDDDGHVRPGHGDQVGQPDGGHAVLGGRRQQPGVARDQPHGEPRSVAVEAPAGSVPHACPDVLGRGEQPTGPRADRDRRHGVDGRDDVSTLQVPLEPVGLDRAGGGAEPECLPEHRRVVVAAQEHAFARAGVADGLQAQDRPPATVVGERRLGSHDRVHRGGPA